MDARCCSAVLAPLQVGLLSTNISSLRICDARWDYELLRVFDRCTFSNLEALYICLNDEQRLNEGESICFDDLLVFLGNRGARLHTMVVRRMLLSSSPDYHTPSAIVPAFVARLKTLELPLGNIERARDLLTISPVEHLTFGLYAAENLGLLSRLWVCLVKFLSGKWKPACTAAHELRINFADEMLDGAFRRMSCRNTVKDVLSDFSRVFSQSKLYSADGVVLHFAPPQEVNFGIVVDLTPLCKMDHADEDST